MAKGMRYLHLIAGLLALSGCATSSMTDGEQEGKNQTSRISRIDAADGGKGTILNIQSDGKLKYTLYQKEQPSRLLLNFPESKLDPRVQPRQLNLNNISAIYPMDNPEGGSKLEIALPQNRAYDVQERPDGLDIVILGDNPEKAGDIPRVRDVVANRTETGTSIQIIGSDNLPAPQAFRLTDPPRLVVDLFGTSNEFKKSTMDINSPDVKRINVGSTPEKTRLVLELNDQQVTFRLDRQMGSPMIQLSHATIQSTATAESGKNVDGSKGMERGKSVTAPSLEGVTFSRDNQDSIIRIRTDRSDVPVDVKRESANLILDFVGAAVPERLSRRMDVSAFGGVVKAIDTFAEGNNGRVVLRLNDTTAVHKLTQQGTEFLVKLQSLANLPAGERAPYTGEKITMDFKDIDIQNALKYVTNISQLNLIMSDTVRGTLTMRLEEVPWDQALDLILEAKGLGKVQQGNVLRVAPLSEIQTMDDNRFKTLKSRQQLEQMVTELMAVSFADPNEIMKVLTSGDEKQNTRLLSSRGNVSLDARTSTLIVTDAAGNLDKIREMVQKLDKPIPQVLIEARIVEITRSDSQNLGIRWGFGYKPSIDGRWAVSSSANSAYNIYSNTDVNVNPRDLMAGSQTFNVNTLNGTSNIGFHMGTLSPLLDLGVELGALERNGSTKIISNPKVLTTNNQAAKINQGVSQPYQTTSSTGTTTMFVDATLSLEVTPKVAPNGFITLDVKATNNSLRSTSTTSAPPIDKKEVQTKVLIKNGETIVLGGIFQNNNVSDSEGIPGLKEIPFLGWAFKNKGKSETQSELLIFITPRIVNQV
ncbi:MAG: type IV pilus secretin PilQ [Magnetococcales bacterium]|nr:type IV pilus secretin PilQ [Magnetococcales bacterium]